MDILYILYIVLSVSKYTVFKNTGQAQRIESHSCNRKATQTPSILPTGPRSPHSPLFYGKFLNTSIKSEVTMKVHGMNPLLVIWGRMCHALECYHQHSMGWIPPFSLHGAMTEFSFLAGPKGEEEGKVSQRWEHKEGKLDWLGAVDKPSA